MLKFLILSLAVACAAKKSKGGGSASCGLAAKIDSALESASALQELYEEYKVEHCVSHAAQQDDMRLELFRQHLTKLQGLAADKSVSWTVGITHLSHLTECEKELFHGHNATKHWGESGCDGYSLESGVLESGVLEGLQGVTPSRVTLPNEWDWRALGAVTPVKDKVGDMSSGWAHAALVPLETAIYRHTRTLLELSVQELVDCTYPGLNKEEGNVRDAWHYLMGHHRLALAADVPETGGIHACDSRITSSPNAFQNFRLAEERRLPPGDYDDYYIAEAVATLAPVVVVMDAANAHLDSYMGGSYNWEATQCDSSYQHAMAIVGYVREFWIIKNNWGTKWGDNGYLWWQRHRKGANCGLLKKPYVPIVKMRDDKDLSEGDEY